VADVHLVEALRRKIQGFHAGFVDRDPTALEAYRTFMQGDFVVMLRSLDTSTLIACSKVLTEENLALLQAFQARGIITRTQHIEFLQQAMNEFENVIRDSES
jgi:hypothetical protein